MSYETEKVSRFLFLRLYMNDPKFFLNNFFDKTQFGASSVFPAKYMVILEDKKI